MTYEKSKAPADAPVTLERLDPLAPPYYSLFDCRGLLVEVPAFYQAESICRAFHLAKLAEEMRAMVERAPLCPPGTTEWKRRFDAIKETT